MTIRRPTVLLTILHRFVQILESGRHVVCRGFMLTLKRMQFMWIKDPLLPKGHGHNKCSWSLLK